jgi:4'-phosphopantetheinyl transferase EntD
MLDGLLPHDVVTEYGDPGEPAPELFPEEAALVANAVAKRRNEFARGRACARAALSRLGIHGFALLSGPEREPLWPGGVVGSVTHTQGFCAVAVAEARRYLGIGIDVEPALPLPAELVERVCRPDELARLSTLDGLEPLTAARLVFSAKEAAYKCQFAITRKYLGFQELGLDLDRDGTFAVRWLCESLEWPQAFRFRGRWRSKSNFLLTAAWLEPAT